MIRSNILGKFSCIVAALATTVTLAHADTPAAAESDAAAKTVAVESTETVEAKSLNTTINADGELVGKVVAEINGSEQPVAAKVTLMQDGVVIESVVADEDGSFAFAAIEPGSYQMYGSVDNFAGSQSYDVGSYAATSYQPSNLVLQPSSEASYDNYAGAPACSMGGSTCGSGCGGGGYGAVGGKRRLLRLGLIGGIVAIAVASPDN